MRAQSTHPAAFCLWWGLCRRCPDKDRPSSVLRLRRYIAAVYWTLTTCTTVGYGDIVAVSDAERGYAMFVLLGGAGE